MQLAKTTFGGTFTQVSSKEVVFTPTSSSAGASVSAIASYLSTGKNVTINTSSLHPSNINILLPTSISTTWPSWLTLNATNDVNISNTVSLTGVYSNTSARLFINAAHDIRVGKPMTLEYIALSAGNDIAVTPTAEGAIIANSIHLSAGNNVLLGGTSALVALKTLRGSYSSGSISLKSNRLAVQSRIISGELGISPTTRGRRTKVGAGAIDDNDSLGISTVELANIACSQIGIEGGDLIVVGNILPSDLRGVTQFGLGATGTIDLGSKLIQLDGDLSNKGKKLYLSGNAILQTPITTKDASGRLPFQITAEALFATCNSSTPVNLLGTNHINRCEFSARGGNVTLNLQCEPDRNLQIRGIYLAGSDGAKPLGNFTLLTPNGVEPDSPGTILADTFTAILSRENVGFALYGGHVNKLAFYSAGGSNFEFVNYKSFAVNQIDLNTKRNGNLGDLNLVARPYPVNGPPVSITVPPGSITGTRTVTISPSP